MLSRLLVIENFGLLAADESESASNLRKAIDAQQMKWKKQRDNASVLKIYANVGAAIDARIHNVTLMEAQGFGKQTLSREAARMLVCR